MKLSTAFGIWRHLKDMSSRTWNVKDLYRTGAWVSLLKEVTRNNLDTVGTQEVRLSVDSGHEKEEHVF